MITLHHIPKELPRFERYAVKIAGENADVSVARVPIYPFCRGWKEGHQHSLSNTELCGFTSLEADEEVRVEVTNDRDFQEIVIRPLSKNVVPEIHGRTVSFTLKESGQYTVEFDGHHECLTIFNNPVNDFGVSPDDENTLYFGAGVHDAGVITLRDGMTVYIDKDAVVYGRIEGYNVKDVRVCGYGILDGSKLERTSPNAFPDWYDGNVYPQDCIEIKKQFAEKKFTESTIQVWYGEHITFEGIITRDPSCFTYLLAKIDGLLIDNVKLIGLWRYNSDGIDLLNCRNVLLENSFVRSFDDSIVFKGVSGFHDWSFENVHVKGCVVWNDWGGALEIGAETLADEYKNIVYEDCDLIHGTQSYMRIHLHNFADIHHIYYRNIRCEYSKYYCMPVLQTADDQVYPVDIKHDYTHAMHIMFYHTDWFSFKPPMPDLAGYIHDIFYENIQIYADEGVRVQLATFLSLDEEHYTHDITMRNIYVNGEKVSRDDDRIVCHELTRNVTVK